MKRITRNNVSTTSSEKRNIQLVLAVFVPLWASEHFALSNFRWFCRRPPQLFVVGCLAPPGCHLALVVVRAPFAVSREDATSVVIGSPPCELTACRPKRILPHWRARESDVWQVRYHVYIIANMAWGGADLTRAQSVTQHSLVGQRDL